MKRQPEEPSDFREFVFTASGNNTDLSKLTFMDVYDNLTAELDRLNSLARLFEGSAYGLDREELSGMSLILLDIHRRAKAILAAASKCPLGRK